MSAQQCPVCYGRGNVRAGFYGGFQMPDSSACVSVETCRTCEGFGIVVIVGNQLQRLHRPVEIDRDAPCSEGREEK